MGYLLFATHIRLPLPPLVQDLREEKEQLELKLSSKRMVSPRSNAKGEGRGLVSVWKLLIIKIMNSIDSTRT